MYEGVVFWTDAIIVASPMRRGSANSLYFKMIERMNCIQNQMLVFFTELGFDVPQFSLIAHSRGWSAEDMERNVAYVQKSGELREGARALAERTVDKARTLIAHDPVVKTERAGRKAHKMDVIELDSVE